MVIVNKTWNKINLLDKRIKIVIGIAMIPLALFLWPSFLGGSTDFLIVEGKSMLPTILPGSFVITKAENSYKVDDIVAFYLRASGQEKIVVHRIIEEKENGFLIQGDNNPTPDPGLFKNDRILGKVTLAIPYVGYMLQLIRNPVIMVISSIVLLMVQMEMSKRKKKKQGKRGSVGFKVAQPAPISYSAQKTVVRDSDFRLFFVASGLNILVYVMQQIALVNENPIGGDLLSGTLYSILDVSVASTLVFSLYFFLFVGVYIYAKRGENARPFIVPKYASQRYSFTNTRLKKGQAIWLGFSLLLGLHVLSHLGILRL
ncbi:MAG: signal peptidase I [Nitrosopumilus sp.]|nr:signal peptidase I [Nitrosopumilus sp.]